MIRSGNCCVSDPKPTCGVAGPPIRGQHVTLSCMMTYRRRADYSRWRVGAGLSAIISWESAAGTFLRKSSTPINHDDGRTIGETLTVDVVTLASATEIPSYKCTTQFQFTDHPRLRSLTRRRFVYALNSVSWSCVSAPVYTWCTHFNLLY